MPKQKVCLCRNFHTGPCKEENKIGVDIKKICKNCGRIKGEPLTTFCLDFECKSGCGCTNEPLHEGECIRELQDDIQENTDSLEEKMEEVISIENCCPHAVYGSEKNREAIMKAIKGSNEDQKKVMEELASDPREQWEIDFDVAYIRGDLQIDPCPDNAVPLKALKAFIFQEIEKAREEENTSWNLSLVQLDEDTRQRILITRALLADSLKNNGK